MSLCTTLDLYLDLVDDTESPILMHRWSFLTSIAAILTRRTHFPMATGAIYPNMYTILLGPPGTRKSTAIRMASEIVRRVGYKHLAGGRTTPEQFLMDMHMGYDTVRAAGDVEILAGADGTDIMRHDCAHAFIQASELSAFLGANNGSFITLLTDLWDGLEDYPYRLRNGTMALIQQPTVSLLGGATADTFKRMFPVDVIGQGTLSRIMLVYGAGMRKPVFDPKPLDPILQNEIVEAVKMATGSGLAHTLTFSDSAYEFSRARYERGEYEISDIRFQHYINRRNDHYIKLAMVIAVLNFNQKIELGDCLLANSILAYTEKFMPMALGEFGLDKAAERTEYVFQLLGKNPMGLTPKELSTQALGIFGGQQAELIAALHRLVATNRIEKLSSKGEVRFVVVPRTVNSNSDLVDFEQLREYVENPTFNTQYVIDPKKLAELEFSLEMERELDAAKQKARDALPEVSILKETLINKLKKGESDGN